jgi:hypothetical protein
MVKCTQNGFKIENLKILKLGKAPKEVHFPEKWVIICFSRQTKKDHLKTKSEKVTLCRLRPHFKDFKTGKFKLI